MTSLQSFCGSSLWDHITRWYSTGRTSDTPINKAWLLRQIGAENTGPHETMVYKSIINSAYQNLRMGVLNMAKAKSVNKSEAIRGALKELPDAKAKEIVAHLKGKGVEVSEQLVYQVKKMSKKKMPGRKPGRKPAKVAAPSSSNGRLGVGASIAVAKAATEKVGGWSALKEIVDALA